MKVCSVLSRQFNQWRLFIPATCPYCLEATYKCECFRQFGINYKKELEQLLVEHKSTLRRFDDEPVIVSEE